MDFNRLTSAQRVGRLQCISRFPNFPYLKPLTIATFSQIHRLSRSSLSQVSSHGEVPSHKKRGIIFEWLQRRKFYSEKELCFFVWFLAHTMFWLHVTNIFPNGTALDLNQPPWRYKPPVTKPENRNYIIEPDWNSRYL